MTRSLVLSTWCLVRPWSLVRPRSLVLSPWSAAWHPLCELMPHGSLSIRGSSLWQAAREQCNRVGELLKRPGFRDDWELSDQMNAASLSVMAGYYAAEGR